MGSMGNALPTCPRLGSDDISCSGSQALAAAGGDLGAVLGLYWGCIGIMENKTKTIIWGFKV